MAAVASTRRALLISNSTTHPSGYLDHCADEIKSFLGTDVSSVLFVPYALKDRDGYAQKAKERFQLLGYELTSLHEAEDKVAAVETAQAMFIGGGNTFRLLSCLYADKVLAVIRKRVVEGDLKYIGTSAGSNVACKTIRTTNDMPIVYPPSFDAINIVPIQINAHYIAPDPSSTHKGETRDQRLKEFHEENDTPVVGLPEGTMLLVQGNTMQAKGILPITIFHKGKAPVQVPVGSMLNDLLV
eukprot:m.128446 g.128446  ORF g.128446 m.128446 type:complete len:242 (+) comp16737_c1_seq1:633-1358(+)